MHRVLFVCFGNICRSPMAEFILKDLVFKLGLRGEFRIESRGTSASEVGSPVFPPAREELKRHGISCDGKTAQQLSAQDYDNFDLLLAMDYRNVRAVERITGGDPERKVHLLLEHTASGGEVADPWYTNRYDVAYRDILEGVESWLSLLLAAEATRH